MIFKIKRKIRQLHWDCMS